MFQGCENLVHGEGKCLAPAVISNTPITQGIKTYVKIIFLLGGVDTSEISMMH